MLCIVVGLWVHTIIHRTQRVAKPLWGFQAKLQCMFSAETQGMWMRTKEEKKRNAER